MLKITQVLKLLGVKIKISNFNNYLVVCCQNGKGITIVCFLLQVHLDSPYKIFPKISKCIYIFSKTNFFHKKRITNWIHAEQRTIQLDKCTCFCEWHVFTNAFT